MHFPSEPLLRSLARDLKYKLPAEKDMPAARLKFDALTYAVSKAYLDLAVKGARVTGCKTVQKQHLQLMEDVACAVRGGKRRAPMRGGTQLPAAFFAPPSDAKGSANSANYFAPDAVVALEHSASGAGLARAELPASAGVFQGGGGGSCGCMKGGGLPIEFFGGVSGQYHAAGGAPVAKVQLPEDVFTQVLKEYKQRNTAASDVRVSDDAKRLLRTHVMCSIVDALRRVEPSKSQTTAMTPARLQKAATTFTLFTR